MTEERKFAPVDKLAGKVAVITGGTGAIGFAAAMRLAVLGARCVLLHRGDAGKAQAKLAGLAGSGHGQIQASVTDTPSLKAAADQVKKEFGRCDILINSAGYTKPVPAADLEGLTDELIDDILRVNFRGVFATIRAFAPMLKENSDGLIVTVSSISGFTGVGSNLAYVAAKASTDVVSDSLARALAPQVRVLSVNPGVVESTFVPGRGADFNAKTAATTPLGRIGHPDDIAAAIEACATTLRFATGTRIVVDGGRHL